MMKPHRSCMSWQKQKRSTGRLEVDWDGTKKSAANVITVSSAGSIFRQREVMNANPQRYYKNI
jgi:hypothetical protein